MPYGLAEAREIDSQYLYELIQSKATSGQSDIAAHRVGVYQGFVFDRKRVVAVLLCIVIASAEVVDDRASVEHDIDDLAS